MNWSDLGHHAIKVYHTTWCPDCRRFEDILKRNSIDFTTVNIDDDPEAADYVVARTGHRAIPYVELDGKHFVKGWHKDKPGRWDETTFFEDVEEVLKAAAD